MELLNLSQNLLEPFPKSPLLPEIRVVVPQGNRYSQPYDNEDNAVNVIRDDIDFFRDAGHGRIYLAGEAVEWMDKDVARAIAILYSNPETTFELAFKIVTLLKRKFGDGMLEMVEEDTFWDELDSVDFQILGIPDADAGLRLAINKLLKNVAMVIGESEYKFEGFNTLDSAKLRNEIRVLFGNERITKMFTGTSDYIKQILSDVKDYEGIITPLPFAPPSEFTEPGYLTKLKQADDYMHKYGVMFDARKGISLYKIAQRLEEACDVLARRNLHTVRNAFEVLVAAHRSDPEAPVIMYSHTANAGLMLHLYQLNISEGNLGRGLKDLIKMERNLILNPYERLLGRYFFDKDKKDGNEKIVWPHMVLYLILSTMSDGIVTQRFEFKKVATPEVLKNYVDRIYEVLLPYIEVINEHMVQRKLAFKKALRKTIDEHLSDDSIAVGFMRMWDELEEE